MRVDDDSAERAQQDARAQQRKLQEQQQKRRSEEATAFDKKLESQKQQSAFSARAQESQKSAKDLIHTFLEGQADGAQEGEGLLGDIAADSMADGEHLADATVGRNQSAENTTGLLRGERHLGEMLAKGKLSDSEVASGHAGFFAQGQAEGEAQQAGKSSDFHADSTHQAERDDRGPSNQTSPRPSTKRVEPRRQKGEQQSGQQNQGQNPAAFRLPPAALMAPPPVAVPKAEGPVSRIREVAKEIAEKIVQHARVGTNKMGLPEFQVELKSQILKGLKVNVSGRHGRIRALFKSRDLAVIKQLRGEIEGLRAALVARGLKVDALEIEEERT